LHEVRFIGDQVRPGSRSEVIAAIRR